MVVYTALRLLSVCKGRIYHPCYINRWSNKNNEKDKSNGFLGKEGKTHKGTIMLFSFDSSFLLWKGRLSNRQKSEQSEQ